MCSVVIKKLVLHSYHTVFLLQTPVYSVSIADTSIQCFHCRHQYTVFPLQTPVYSVSIADTSIQCFHCRHQYTVFPLQTPVYSVSIADISLQCFYCRHRCRVLLLQIAALICSRFHSIRCWSFVLLLPSLVICPCTLFPCFLTGP